MKKYYTHGREAIYVGNQIGQGGEGVVYQVVKNDTLVVKIYKKISRQPQETAQAYEARLRYVRAGQEQKILAMIANPPHDAMRAYGHVSIAWPIAAIYDGTQFVGFCMPKVNGFPVYEVTQPNIRNTRHPQWTHRNLYRLAQNMAKAIDALHRKGYVIGDVNFNNMLCHDNALVTLIDCDSMQVRDAQGRLYRCPVGMPEFTPRELQGADWHVVNRTANHDCFGFAVILFQLLMQGFHPFAGRCLDPRKEIEQVHVHCIVHGIFPYGGDTTVFAPPPAAPAYALLPGSIRNHFRLAFTQPDQRPSVASWAEILNEVEKRLTVCPQNPHHYYPSDGGCVQCAVDQNVARINGTTRINTVAPLGGTSAPVGAPGSRMPSSSSSLPTTGYSTTAHVRQTWWGLIVLGVMLLSTRVVWPSIKWVVIHCWQLLGLLWSATRFVSQQWLWPAVKYFGRVAWLLFGVLGRSMRWFVWAPGAPYRVVIAVLLAAIGGVYIMPKGYLLWSRIYPQCTATAMIQQQWPMLPPAVVAQMDAQVVATPIAIDGVFVANKSDIHPYQTQFARCVGEAGVVTATVDATQVAIAHEYMLIAYRRLQYPRIQWHDTHTIMTDIAHAYQRMAPHGGFAHLQLATLATADTPDSTYDWLLPTDGHWLMTGTMATHNRTIHADGYVEGSFSDMQIVAYPTPSRLAVQLTRNDIVLILPADGPMMAQYLAMAPFPADYRVLLIPTGNVYAIPR